MKTIFLNQAIICYVEFMRRVIDMKKNPDEKSEMQYQVFVSRYRQMKHDKDIRSSVSDVRFSCLMDTDLIKIYYVDMPQLWAFLHLVIERILEKEISLSFWLYKTDDFMRIKDVFKHMWFIKKSHHGFSYIYLEDEKNKVDIELKLYHTRLGFERCQENIEHAEKVWKAAKYNMKEMSKMRA